MEAKISMVEVNGQRIPMAELDGGRKVLVLSKIEGGKMEVATLEMLMTAGTNPVVLPFIKEDGTVDLGRIKHVMPKAIDSIQRAMVTARKAGTTYRFNKDTRVCPMCGHPLGMSGVNHLTQKHGGRIFELEERWGLQPGDMRKDLFIDRSLFPVFSANGAKGNPAKAAKNGDAREAKVTVEDELANLDIEW